MTTLDDFWPPPETSANPAAPPPRRHRHVWTERRQVEVQDGLGTLLTLEAGCALCGRPRDEARSKLGRRNRKRGNRAELTVARRYGGEKIGPLQGPGDIRGAVYATQVKTHVGLPPAWVTKAPAIRVTLRPAGYVWICDEVLGEIGHMAEVPAHWPGIFEALEADSRTPRLIERWTRQGAQPFDLVVVRAKDEPSGLHWWGHYVAWHGEHWLDLYGRDE